MRLRNAFTMIELIFVIVVMGIIGKFGTEFLAQAYSSFIFSNVNNTLQAKSAKTVEFIASRLQYRIKDSLIARVGTGGAAVGISSAAGNTYTVLEWISADIDGFRGKTKPYWSGILDLDASSATRLVSPDTNTTAINALIATLSNGTKTINNAALYFIGSNNDLTTYGWNGVALTNQGGSIHPIKDDATTAALNDFESSIALQDFTGVDLYEYYKLTWTANAIVYTPGANNMGTLTYWYNYQPWNGESLAANNGTSAVIMEGISTFQFMSIGSIIKIQVCTKSEFITEDTYSLCKEKTIF